jgi:hypothetical protein
MFTKISVVDDLPSLCDQKSSYKHVSGFNSFGVMASWNLE